MGVWHHLRKLWFRVVLLVLSVGLVGGAVAVLFQPAPAAGRPAPLPVAANEYEVVWLYAATNTAAWERFVAAVQRTGERLREREPNLEVEVGLAAFPRQTTAVPEVALRWRDTGTRLVFRWYKLTSDWKTRDWVEALARRDPPPLAVIGGSSSDGAREAALQLEQAGKSLPEKSRPLLLLTTASADKVARDPAASEPAAEGDADAGKIELTRLYPRRTFRYCFTNRQMAAAIMQFIWQDPNLHPDSRPIYTVRWGDDSYSLDLIDGFLEALQKRFLAWSLAREWAWTAGCVGQGAPPFALAGGLLPRRNTDELSAPQYVVSSVGTFATPNRFEAQAARFVLDEMDKHPQQRRPLLIVSGQSQPSRRFLRAVARAAPDRARQFVVATGDTLAFNTVYRDHMTLWPIQDLPFKLVFFCHHNPIDPSGFDPERGQVTGTEDLLLFGDIVETLALAQNQGGRPCGDAAALAARLAAITWRDGDLGFEEGGPRLFGRSGNRRSGTSEHVVSLRPHTRGERVLPEATIEVWERRVEDRAEPTWARRGEPLPVRYVDAPGAGDVP
jgi:hypothetical protein